MTQVLRVKTLELVTLPGRSEKGFPRKEHRYPDLDVWKNPTRERR